MFIIVPFKDLFYGITKIIDHIGAERNGNEFNFEADQKSF